MEQEKNNVGFNTACEQLRQNLINDINISNLPIASVYYILQTINQQIENAYYATLNEEAMQHPRTISAKESNLSSEKENNINSVESQNVGQ